jgi:hypothetical protein
MIKSEELKEIICGWLDDYVHSLRGAEVNFQMDKNSEKYTASQFSIRDKIADMIMSKCRREFIKDDMGEILQLVELFNLETFNVNDKYFCIKGINGNATVVYYDKDPITTVKNHLIQVGRDSLKMDLNYLLDITKHN